MTPDALVAQCSAVLEPLDRAANQAWWDANVNATETTAHARSEAMLALSDALADADAFAEVRAGRASSGLDPHVARQLELLDQVYTPNQGDSDLRRQIVQLETDIDARFSVHRSVIDGESVDDNAILSILRGSTDAAEREAAWYASKSVGPTIAADVRRLARLRNDAARSLGFRDHFAMTLATSEFDEQRLFATLEAVDEITAAPFREMKAGLDDALVARFGITADRLRPWHYDDPFFQEAPLDVGVDLDPYLGHLDLDELTLRTFDSMGLDVRPVLDRSDLLPRERKVQHAFCIDIDRGGDVRVLSNNTPSERWTETMLHEFGHAAYFCGVDDELPWLLRNMHMCLTEGVAMRCGRLVHDPAWLRAIAGLSAGTVDDLVPRLRLAQRGQLLLFARWVLVMTHFERGLYANPDGPHDAHWWDLVERFQLVQRPDGREAPDWAAKIHISSAPVYYHNYLFGELVASQLSAAFGGLVDSPDAGHLMSTRLFAPGATQRWDELIAQATGSTLTPDVLARELAN